MHASIETADAINDHRMSKPCSFVKTPTPLLVPRAAFNLRLIASPSYPAQISIDDDTSVVVLVRKKTLFLPSHRPADVLPVYSGTFSCRCSRLQTRLRKNSVKN